MNQRTNLMAILFALATITATSSAVARNTIEVVGSSTVYPFSTVVAERYGRASGKPTPKIESGSGGMKLFCSGVGSNYPDITNASRRMKASEFKLCQGNGVKEIIEVQIGYDGIVLANSVKAEAMNLTRKDIFLALAAQVPGEKEGELIDNPYTTWKQVNASLPVLLLKCLARRLLQVPAMHLPSWQWKVAVEIWLDCCHEER